jgi:hypothetical protein
MNDLLVVPVDCPKFGKVRLPTRDWWLDDEKRIHYRADCYCCNQHLGTDLPRPEFSLNSH